MEFPGVFDQLSRGIVQGVLRAGSVRGKGRTGRRILVVAPQPFYEDRGTPIAVLQVVTALSELGHQVDVLTYPVGTPVQVPAVEVYRCRNPLRIRHVPIGLSLQKIVLDASLVLALRGRLRRTRYDCIHAVEEAAFPAVWMGRARGVPVIYDMQSSLPEQLTKHRLLRLWPIQKVLRSCEAWLLGRVDVVISSTGLAQRVRESGSHRVTVREWAFYASNVVASPHETEALRQELGIPPSHRVVLYTGSFEEYQGLDILVAAIPDVRARVPDTTFVLVGSTPDRSSGIPAMAGRLGLNRALKIVPRQPRERIRTFLAMADVLVSPRAYGGNLPLKIFEYMAAGRPIVATDIPTHRALLNEERAVMVQPGPVEMAEGITRLLQDPALATSVADAAHAYAKAQFGWGQFVSDVDEGYSQVLSRAREPVA
jgi:glycosyltransferase involved in cell wall biosynthesis